MLRERPRPFVYALLVHVLLIGVLVFSLDWTQSIKPSTAKKPAPVQAVVVDGAKLDAEVKRKQELEALKKAEAERKLKAEADKQRKAEEARKQAAAEKQRKAAEARKKAEAEKQRKAEEARKQAEAERKRKEEEARKKAEAERKRQEEAARKAAEAEMQARLAAEQERVAAQRQSAMQRIINEYVGYITEKVQRSWIRPPSSGAELTCAVQVRLIPGGEVIDVRIVRSSGNGPFDRSVETAVFKASPLPVPADPEIMEEFRSLTFEFKPG